MGKFLGRFYVCTLITSVSLELMDRAISGYGWYLWVFAAIHLICMFFVMMGGVE